MLGSSLAGCAYSVVAGGQIRPAAFHNVLQHTVRARAIPLDTRVDARVVSQEGLLRVLEDALDSQWSEVELQRYERALIALGLWPRDRSLRAEFLAVMNNEVAGLYVPADEALYLVRDISRPFTLRFFSFILRRDLVMEAVLSHEIVHLLQHRAHPSLLEFALGHRNQDDLDLAIQSALEGDATRYSLEAMGIPAARLPPEKMKKHFEEEMKSSSHSVFVDAPALIRLTLGFPYVEGYRLSYSEGFNLLDNPPASTEQALHPSRRYEPFWVFDLGEAIAALPPGCVFEHANTLGELQMSVLFRDLGDAQAPAAWEGWDGDRFLVAECSGQIEFAWLTAWDSEEDAREFEAAYGEIALAAASRAGFEAPPLARRGMREVVVTSTGLLELGAKLPSLARRRQVSSVEEILEHFSREVRP